MTYYKCHFLLDLKLGVGFASLSPREAGQAGRQMAVRAHLQWSHTRLTAEHTLRSRC